MSPLTDWVFRLIALGTLIATVFISVQTHSFVSCQAQYNDYLVKRTAALSTASSEFITAQQNSDDAITTFIESFDSNPAPTAAQDAVSFNTLQTALQAEQKAEAKYNAAKAANPAPKQPTQVCKG